MIETEAYVVRDSQKNSQSDDDWIWIETTRQSPCNTCGVKSGCGTSTFAKVLGQRPTRILARNDANARQGDKVLVGIDESAYLWGSFLLYGAPLLAAGVAAVTMRLWMGPGDGLEILAALVGLAAGFAWARRVYNRSTRIEAVALRRLPDLPVTTNQRQPIS